MRFEAAKLDSVFDVLDALAWLNLPNVAEIPSDINNEAPTNQSNATQQSNSALGDEEQGKGDINPGSARSVIHVNVTLDSSLDTDKLERQLALLRKYGAL